MAETYELGVVMVQRHLEAIAGDGTRAPVVLTMGRPLPDTLPGRSGEDWLDPKAVIAAAAKPVSPGSDRV